MGWFANIIIILLLVSIAVKVSQIRTATEIALDGRSEVCDLIHGADNWIINREYYTNKSAEVCLPMNQSVNQSNATIS